MKTQGQEGFGGLVAVESGVDCRCFIVLGVGAVHVHECYSCGRFEVASALRSADSKPSVAENSGQLASYSD
jgi:hypothetical protein